MKHICPFCTKDMPSGLEPALWSCCGEVGRAYPCNAEDNEGQGCTANDGEPCEVCEKERIEEMRYWSRLYEVATLEEKDPEAYRRNLIESGRGHLLSTVAKWEDV